jgi:hypothetical protein
MRDSAQSADFQPDILVKNLEIPMMFVTSRCNNAGPLGKPIPTRSFVASLLARLAVTRLRW